MHVYRPRWFGWEEIRAWLNVYDLVIYVMVYNTLTFPTVCAYLFIYYIDGACMLYSKSLVAISHVHKYFRLSRARGFCSHSKGIGTKHSIRFIINSSFGRFSHSLATR